MAHYAWINSERLSNARANQTVDGIELKVELSPYATPRKVSGCYDKANERFVIKFDYIDDEPTSKPCEIDGVIFVEGKYSGKLISISIPVDEEPHKGALITQLQSLALDALKEREAQLGERLDNRLNQSVAREIIEHDLGGLVGA